MYGNEQEVGHGITKYLSSPLNTSNLERKDIFYTTKLATNGSYKATKDSIDASLKLCGLDYIDLYLLHSPYGGSSARLETWRAVEDAIVEGKIKSGGVSNYGVKHVRKPGFYLRTCCIADWAGQLEELLGSKPRIAPVVNQIEVHPFLTRTDITSYCKTHDIVVEAYSPLVRAERMEHPVIQSFSQKYSCSPAQLLIRWSMQHGYVVLPKSVKKERILENIDIDGFTITEIDMDAIDALDEHFVTGKVHLTALFDSYWYLSQNGIPQHVNSG